MSSKKGSSRTKKSEVVYVVTSLLSRKNENIGDNEMFVFRDQGEARGFMRDHAKQLFYENIKMEKEPKAVKAEDGDNDEGSSNGGESSRKSEIRQGTPVGEGRSRRGHFFNEEQYSINFGEDKLTGVFSYRRTWGIVSLKEVTIDEKKAF